jgi:glutamate N-acetyltransferase / amino-acid N-acetyltransferase
MPVHLNIPPIETIFKVPGACIKHAQAGIRKPNRKDVLVIELAKGSSVAGVFTQNLFCAAPVQIAKQHLQDGSNIRALVVNTGNANAATGEAGLLHAKVMCQAVAKHLSLDEDQVLPFSTGVILEPLPIDRVISGIEKAISSEEGTWLEAAETIMTTDTLPKVESTSYINQHGETIYITGISKGAGMIRPNMATMLGFITSNAHIKASDLNEMIQRIVNQSFNNISIDGDTSTNDSFIIATTNQSTLLDKSSDDYQAFELALTQVAKILAQKIVRDGEGATKFITVSIKNAPSSAEAKKIAYAIAHSPLVKTAFFASDPNLGRILAAVGYSGANIDVTKIDMWINQAYVVKQGARHPDYQEADGQIAMKSAEITILIDLHQGQEDLDVWTCDLSHEYVSINADYRS